MNMSGPISRFINQPLMQSSLARSKAKMAHSNQGSNVMLKTATTAISPMNVTQVNSTKNKLSQNNPSSKSRKVSQFSF